MSNPVRLFEDLRDMYLRYLVSPFDLDGRLVFASFRDFPWFRTATLSQLRRVERPSPHHLYWPELDVDLEVESLAHPERYPLTSRL